MSTLNRRQFLNQLGLSSIGLITASNLFQFSCLPEKWRRKPNIIFILADDLGYGDLSCYGQTKFQTPHLDRMAAEGIRFTDHYAGSTVCAPSRCSLMTGLHTGHARVRGNWEKGPHGWGACLELRPEDQTVAEILKKAGYATGAFGKWSLGIAPTTGAPWKKGFDRWFGYLNQGLAHYYYPEKLWDNDQEITIEANLNGQQQVYSHDLILNEALKFVDANKSNPFFMYLAVTIPHAELLVPDDSLNEFKDKFTEVPFEGGHYAAQEKPQAAFAGMVTRLDRDLGRLMEKLKVLGIDDDTLVMFSSDNGPHKEGGHDPAFFNSNGGLRGFKRDLYEGGIRVPLIARWPGKIKAGTTSAHPSAFWDFFPTVCDIAGIQSPPNPDGISFRPTLLGAEQKTHDYLYWEFHENPTSDQAIRKGKWKAVRHSPAGPIELYDLDQDRIETNDIAAEHPEVVAEMVEIFKNARTPHEIWSLKE
jgi:arylsulfatase A-like enzyme